MDLAVWYRQGRWVALLELIDQLPATSRFMEAVVNDPEAAAEIVAMADQLGEDDSAPTVRMSEYSPLLQGIHHLTARVDILIGVTADKYTPQPLPAPRTAIQEAREAKDREEAIAFGARLGFSPEDFA